jgi:hypothetical protein
MFKKLIERIDAINDYVNPIVVRDMRRAFGRGQMNWLLMIYACFVIVGCLLYYVFGEMDSLELGNSTGFDFCCVAITTWASIICSTSVVDGEGFMRNLEDEMFLIIPITPRQQLHAYMFETFIFTTFWSSLFAPVVLMAFWLSPNFLTLAVIMTCGNALIGQATILVSLSFSARIKTKMQANLFALFIVIFSLILMYSCIGIFVFVGTIMSIDSSKYSLIFHTIYISLPIGLLLITATAYRLSSYAFKTRNKSIVRMYLLNIFCYTLLSVVITLICLGVAFVVFNFL